MQLSEYTIRYVPPDAAHRFRHPVGFFADTRTVHRERAQDQGSMKIQALAGLRSHVLPEHAAADTAGELFLSMECTGTHLVCAGDSGCGEQFDYQDADWHCQHLRTRTRIRHIVNPPFRGGALIVPPIRPGWKNVSATVLSSEGMPEAPAGWTTGTVWQTRPIR